MNCNAWLKWTTSIFGLVILAALLEIVGCGSSTTQPCQNNGYLACIDMTQVTTPLCPPMGNKISTANVQWAAVNKDKTDTLNVLFDETENLYDQQLPSPQSQDRWVDNIPPNTNISPFGLGCKYEDVPEPGAYNEWDYQPIKACLVTDNACNQGQAAQAPPNPAAQNCLTQCAGPNCIRYAFNVLHTPAEVQARTDFINVSQQLLTTPNLTSFDLSSLLGIGNACPNRGKVSIGSGGAFVENGVSTCHISLTLTTSAGQPISVLVTLPTVLNGKFSQTLGIHAVLDFNDSTHAPQLTWSVGNTLEAEAISKIDISEDTTSHTYTAKIVGSRAYCIWITALPGLKVLPLV
jgi:hypothetical protein